MFCEFASGSASCNVFDGYSSVSARREKFDFHDACSAKVNGQLHAKVKKQFN